MEKVGCIHLITEDGFPYPLPCSLKPDFPIFGSIAPTLIRPTLSTHIIRVDDYGTQPTEITFSGTVVSSMKDIDGSELLALMTEIDNFAYTAKWVSIGPNAPIELQGSGINEWTYGDFFHIANVKLRLISKYSLGRGPHA